MEKTNIFMCGQYVCAYDEKIVRVEEGEDFYDILTEQHSGHLILKRDLQGVVPCVGDKVRLYTINTSYLVGLDWNGKSVFFSFQGL